MSIRIGEVRYSFTYFRLFFNFGLFQNNETQPTTLPIVSVKASFLLVVVMTLVARIAINNKVIACHFN